MTTARPCAVVIDEICDLFRQGWRYLASTWNQRHPCRFLPVRLSSYGLLSSVRPCTLFPDIHPCMSGKGKFCAQNLLLINFPPILGRSDDKFFYRKTCFWLVHRHPWRCYGETESAKCVEVECKTEKYAFCVYTMCENLPCRYVYRKERGGCKNNLL